MNHCPEQHIQLLLHLLLLPLPPSLLQMLLLQCTNQLRMPPSLLRPLTHPRADTLLLLLRWMHAAFTTHAVIIAHLH
jgi:hypothetical protein